MSSATTATTPAPTIERPGALELLRKALALVVTLSLVVIAQRLAPEAEGPVAPLLALGMFLLAGDIAAELGERIGLPHLTGYLLAGLLVGPQVLGAVSQETVEQLGLMNTLALALIALSAGAELTLPLLTQGARTLLYSIGAQVAIALPGGLLLLLTLKHFLPFMAAMSWTAAVGVALLWGVLSVSRSPSATLGVISQLRPDGPLTRYTLSVVIAFDLVVLVAFTLARSTASVLVDPDATFSFSTIEELATGILGSFACGTTLGLLIAAYLRLVGKQLLLFLILVAYGATEFTTYFQFESLLLFLTAGFVVANVTDQGGRLLDVVAAGGRVVYVLFFALAGAHLDLRLLAHIWPVALVLFFGRVGLTAVAARTGARMANDSDIIRRYGWMPLVSQAGITIGMAVKVAAEFPTFGPDFRALVIAVVGLNEGFGPILFKWALDKVGESGKGMASAHHGH